MDCGLTFVCFEGPMSMPLGVLMVRTPLGEITSTGGIEQRFR